MDSFKWSLMTAFVVSVLLLVALLLLASPEEQNLTSPEINWSTYSERVDYVTPTGLLITDISASEGIRILPENYEEKKVEYSIAVYDPRTQKTKTHTIFEEIDEFTRVKFLPNQINGSRIWVVSFDEELCTDAVLSQEVRDCRYDLYEYDLNREDLDHKQEINYIVGRPVRDVYLLEHDPLENIVWIGVDHQIDEDQFVSYGIEDPDPNRNYFVIDLNRFDANDNNDSFPASTYRWMSSRFASEHKSLAASGKNASLYFIGECQYDCEDVEDLNRYVMKYGGDDTRRGVRSLPIFYYGQEVGSERGFQVISDTQNNWVYVVTKTFDQNKESYIFRYDENTGRTKFIGRQPTKYEDDIRGMDIVGGRLAVGTFNGLGVYDRQTDSWTVIKEEQGLMSNDVEGVYEIKDGGVCVTHGDSGASCLLSPLSDLIKGN